MELRKLVHKDRKHLAEICEKAIPSHYYVTEEALEQKLFFHPCFYEDASFSLWEDDVCLGFIGIKLPGYEALFPATAWLSILVVREDMQRKGYGSLLLEKAQDVLKAIGIKKWIVGQDFACFFSGLPEVTEVLCGFFRKNAFDVSEDFVYYDLEGNVQENPLMEAFVAEPFEPHYKVCTYNKEEAALLSFLQQEFPGRWKYEVETALRMGKSHEEITLLWDTENKEIVGFCMLSKEPDGRGKLGPIGISEKVRGKGLGEYFLCKSLFQLKKLGRDRVNIDWTVLTKFYGKFAFLPERTYCSAYKNI